MVPQIIVEIDTEENGWPLVRFDSADSPSLITMVSKHITDTSLSEHYLVEVPQDVARARIVDGRTLFITTPEAGQSLLGGSTTIEEDQIVSTINITQFGELPNGLKNWKLIELSTGVTAEEYRNRGIMSEVLHQFNSYPNLQRVLETDEAPKGNRGIVFGSFLPDNEYITNALVNAQFVLLHQTGEGASQRKYPFASTLLHLWPADAKYGVRNHSFKIPAFCVEDGLVEGSYETRGQSLAIGGEDWNKFMELEGFLVEHYRTIDNLIKAIQNSRTNKGIT